MGVPEYQKLMQPLLELARDEQEHSLSEVIETLAQQFSLTPEDRKELLPSGWKAKFDNRVGWARTYLKKAKMLESSGRGRFRITKRGLDFLMNNPKGISSYKELEQFPEFVDFKAGRGETGTERKASIEDAGRTPEETLESAYAELRQTLAQDILERVKKCSPSHFERIVVDLLLKMGYGGSRKDTGEVIGRTGDGGIDGRIKEDKLGLDVVYMQAKRWDRSVGEPEVRDFVGGLEGKKAEKGVFITTGKVADTAVRYAGKIGKRVVLIDGDELAQLMIDHGVGVSESATYSVRRIDQDYFDEEE